MLQTMKTKAASKKLKKTAGFTLVELLVVVAIIAILAAVAVPAYTASMEKARESADLANVSAAAGLATTDYMMENRSGSVVYEFATTGTGNLAISKIGGASVTGVTGNAPAPQSAKCKATTALTITVENGMITANPWQVALTKTTP